MIVTAFSGVIMNILAIVLNIFLFDFYYSESTKHADINLIKDVIESYDRPTSVYAKLCWETSWLIDLANEIFKIKNPVAITFGKIGNVEEVTPSNHILFLVDTTCNNSHIVLQEADAHQQFRRSYRWLVLETQGSGYNSKLLEIEPLNILIDSDVLLATKIENVTYVLKKIYKISTQSEWITEDYGNWTAEHGLIMSNIISSDASRRRNIRGHPVTTSIIVTENRTKSELDDLKNLLSDSLAKICFRHTKNLCQFMNASHKIGFASMWGYKTNGTWNGMMGDLAKGTVDFGGTIAFLTSQRLQVVDYLSSPVPINAKFVFREPPLSYQNNLFLLPYKANVWYCTAAFVVLLVIILYINAKWEIKKAEYEQAGINKTALQPSVSDVTILVISAISQQGSSNELKGTLGRAVLFLLFLTFLFLYISYSANIVALLQSNSKQIRTLQDLLNSKLELGVEDIVYNRYYFSTATEPIRKAIYETKVAPKGSKANFMSIEEGVKKLQKSPFAFNMNIGTGYKIIERYFEEHEKCGLQEINYIESSIPWMSCRKNSPFREIYKLGLFKLQEHGITDRENRLLFARKPVCIVRGGNVGSVNMVDVYPVILMFLYGLFLAFLILLVEIVVHRKLSKVIVV
uniref:Ionotropic receptor n=1 Tax=Bombyx mori TaxID=7091 RepID=A0A8R2R0U0_BOMMO|nr:ionotropic receptor 75a-like [Bombyx mori]